MLIESQPLAEIAEALRSGALDLHDYIDRVLSHIAVDEESVQSLLPELGRRERLQAALDNFVRPERPDEVVLEDRRDVVDDVRRRQ